MAGVCAAISAARMGARVVLVQDRPVLGGNASSEIRMHIVGADCHGERPGARETGLIEEFRLEDAARNPHRSYSQWDLLLYEKVVLEPGIRLLLNAVCTGCETRITGNTKTILSAHITRQSTEEEFVVSAKFFADCSGDGRLGAEAGADFRIGREGVDEFGESLALARSDRKTLGSSILFTARKYPDPQPFLRPGWARQFGREEFRLRPIRNFEYGYWWAEWGGQLDTIGDNETIRHELLRIALGIWDYVKNSGDHPGSANWALDWVGAIPGKRESRRFLGPHILSQKDLEAGTLHPDSVAYGGWWIDLHPPSGVDATEESPCAHHQIPHLYGIPLRCLYSRNIGNLFFAGRNISATHVAFSSTRVMATCATMGQAAGTAAAILSKRDALPGSAQGKLAIPEIQQALLKNDAFLPGIRNEDPADLAPAAMISSSSGLETAPRVTNGISRDTRSLWGNDLPDASNAWRSEKLPAWIELEWEDYTPVAEVHLTFCSGLHRELILSPSDSASAKVIRGPQPETIKSYRLLFDGTEVLRIDNNVLRKRCHAIAGTPLIRRLRLEILETWGEPFARVFEIRAYPTKN